MISLKSDLYDHEQKELINRYINRFQRLCWYFEIESSFQRFATRVTMIQSIFSYTTKKLSNLTLDF